MSFLTGGQTRSCLGVLVSVGGERRWERWRVSMEQTLCTHVCNGKMRPVETISEWRHRG
jgi:hypothetical protein